MYFDFQQFLKQCGVSIANNEFVLVDSKRPSIHYSRKLGSFILDFPGPVGFGRQQFAFDFYDFTAAYYDTQYSYRQAKSSRYSFREYFLGEEWYKSEKNVRIAAISFCFNLTPSILKKANSYHCKIKLAPKLNHCKKILSFTTSEEFLNSKY